MWRQVKVHNVLSSTNSRVCVCASVCLYMYMHTKDTHALDIKCKETETKAKKHSQMSAAAVTGTVAAVGCYHFTDFFLSLSLSLVLFYAY